LLKAKAKALTFKAKAKDSKFVLEDTPRTKAKDNNTGEQSFYSEFDQEVNRRVSVVLDTRRRR